MTKNVFFIGDVALDEYYSAPYFPKLKDKVLMKTLPAQMGGMIANAACIYSSYKPNAQFIGTMNRSSFSLNLLNNLNKAGLSTSYTIFNDDLCDSKTIIILSEGEHTVLIPTLGIETVELTDEAFNALCSADYIYGGHFSLCALRYKGMSYIEILNTFRASGCKIYCDIDVGFDKEGNEKLIEALDVIFSNEKGFEDLQKHAHNTNPIPWLYSKGVSTVVVTLDKKGCKLYNNNLKESPTTIDGLNVNAVDVTGAGDTFCSTFMYANTITDDLTLCAEFANIAAAKSVTGMGPRSGACGFKELEKFMVAMDIDPQPFKIFE